MSFNQTLEKKYSLIIAILFFALFSNIRYQTNFGLIRLFDILTIFFFLYFFKKVKYDISKTDGQYYILPFLFIHVLLSYKLGFNNILREFFQCIIIVSFISILVKSKKEIDYKILLKYLLLVSSLMIAITIIWHLYRGFWVGWKLLPDTRLAYTFFTVLFFLYFKIYNKNKSLKFKIYSLILLIILVLSGERKAVAIFIFLFLLTYFRGIGIKSLIILLLFYFTFAILTNYVKNPYIKNKIDTTLNIMSTGNFNYVLDTGKISKTDTYSNAQRTFSIYVSKKIFSSNPFLGIGTNSYKFYVDEKYWKVANFLKLGIHGEFQRILAENGLLGFILYIFVWLKSWNRFKHELNNLTKLNLISYEKSRYILYAIYFSTIFYVATEASSLRSFILLGVITILPDLLNSFIIKYKNSNQENS